MDIFLEYLLKNQMADKDNYTVYPTEIENIHKKSCG